MLESIFLFPGMILHELAHAIACVLLGVRVTKTKLWGPSGASVSHQTTTGWKNFAISIVPFFVNSILAIVVFYLGHIGSEKFFQPAWAIIVFYWLGISFAYFAFPSSTDLSSGWRTLWQHYKSRMLFKKGIVSALIHWITLPLLIPAWIVLTVLGLMNRPKAGLAWAVILFLVTALYVGL